MKKPQYIIDGNTVTCTVFNEYGVSFMATTQAADAGDLYPAMASALEQAEKTRNEYETETKED
ncbi:MULTISPECIES: hypothetical protein [Klebsiella/Raoultella group]|uniref:hypothetical protein n=1 Tax=Klebsiella/Raoultella group TaxID=2890311 RepID=UPI00109CC74E|nr:MULTISPECIES: hypothetical protein [Klebsiella/Raoultella group]UDC53414.1 hypothetical protein LGM24_18015 [Klebsiella quasipneumoniae subsp. quasipneumoniae]VGP26696.1 hypothetical protein SB02110_03315 [Klebsiella quasipneumoniae subsp. quasipneumoniae]VTN40527.1 Uncharacterised protein [Raoultella ornithinolytica]VTN41235.1 Uncharacterised protein [Raoultella ornithinolytica]